MLFVKKYILKKIGWTLIFVGFLSSSIHSQIIDNDFVFSDALDGIFDPGFESMEFGPSLNEELMNTYKAKNYRSAVVHLKKFIDLSLPDGRQDFYHFLLAECYFQLRLFDLAKTHYDQVLYYVPQTKYKNQSLFRLLQIHAENNSERDLEYSWNVLKKAQKEGPLLAGGAYVYAKYLGKYGRYDEALYLLSEVSDPGIFNPSFQYLKSICYAKLGQSTKAIDTLEALTEKTEIKALKEEALLTLGKLYHQNDNLEKALGIYSQISSQSSLYASTQLKKAFVYLSLKRPTEAIAIARQSLNDPLMYYEASLVLIDSYYANKDTLQAQRTWEFLSLRSRLTRMRAFIEEEKILVQDLNWKIQRLQVHPLVLEKSDQDLQKELRESEKRTQKIEKELQTLQTQLQDYREFLGEWKVQGILEKKLLEQSEMELKTVQNDLQKNQLLAQLGHQESVNQQQGLLRKQENLIKRISDLKIHMKSLKSEQDGIADGQAKFIDVGLLMYQRIKRSVQASNAQLREYTKIKREWESKLR